MTDEQKAQDVGSLKDLYNFCQAIEKANRILIKLYGNEDEEIHRIIEINLSWKQAILDQYKIDALRITRTPENIYPVCKFVFIEELVNIYRKYGLSIGQTNENSQFTIEPYCEANEDWLREAVEKEFGK